MRALLIVPLAGLAAAVAFGAPDRASAKIVDEGPILALAAGDDAVWAWLNSYELVRVDPRRMAITARATTVPAMITALTVGEGAVWGAGACGLVRCRYGVFVRFDPGTGWRSHPLTPLGLNPRGIAAGYGSVWVLGARRVLRMDPRSRRMSAPPIQVGRAARAIAVGAGAVWVTTGTSVPCRLVRIDPGTATVVSRRPIACGSAPTTLAVASGRAGTWVTRFRDVVTGPYGERRGQAVLLRLDASGVRQGTPLRLGEAPTWLPRVAVGAGALWVANAPTGTITRIDADGRRIEARVRIPPRASGGAAG